MYTLDISLAFFHYKCFYDQISEVFDMSFVCCALHNFTLHDHFEHFSYVHGLLRGVPITCPAFHVQFVSPKFALSADSTVGKHTP